MSITNVHNMGAYLKMVAGHSPIDSVAAVINGAAIERTDYKSCKLHAACGLASSTPTTQSVISKLQQSVDGSTGWTDVTGAATTDMTADDGDESVDVDLGGVENYIRVVTTIAFTGGTTPAIDVQSAVVLGGAMELPAA